MDRQEGGDGGECGDGQACDGQPAAPAAQTDAQDMLTIGGSSSGSGEMERAVRIASGEGIS